MIEANVIPPDASSLILSLAISTACFVVSGVKLSIKAMSAPALIALSSSSRLSTSTSTSKPACFFFASPIAFSIPPQEMM